MFKMFNGKKQIQNTAEYLKWLMDRENYPNTPDVEKLWRKELHNVFLSDEFMRNRRMHSDIAEHGFCAWPSAFAEPRYSLWREIETGKVIPLPKGYVNSPQSLVKGEIWSIFADRIPKLDKYKTNGVQFIRKRVKIIVPYIEVRETYGYGKHSVNMIKSVTCWFYEGLTSFWNERLDAGYNFQAFKPFTPNAKDSPRYYYYTKLED